MHIDALRLKNCRGFEEFEVDLHPEVTLLAGENGAGKTCLFDALVYVVWESLAGPGLPRPAMTVQDDTRVVPRTLNRTVTLEPQLPIEFSWTVSVDGVQTVVTGSRNAIGKLRTRAKARQKQVAEGNPVVLPLVAAYPAHRGWFQSPTPKEPSQPTRMLGYHGWAAPASNQVPVVSWMKQYRYAELEDGVTDPRLEALRAALIACIPGCVAVDFSARANALQFSFQSGQIVDFQRLSDGFRTIIAMVADLAWRAVVLNPQFAREAPKETPGVVLIDEIELHLHPRWQWEILGALRRTFPNVQFIATTHAAPIVASAKAEWIRVLRPGAKRAEPVGHAQGRDVNTVLERIMGARRRSQDMTRVLDQLAAHIEEGDRAGAAVLLEEARTRLGEDDATVIGLEWEFLAMSGDGDDSADDPS